MLKSLSLALAAFLAVSASANNIRDTEVDYMEQGFEETPSHLRKLQQGRRPRCRPGFRLAIKLENLARSQPFSPFFVAIHERLDEPLFRFNEPASSQLATLAEDGDPQPLADLFSARDGVEVAGVTTVGIPPRGEPLYLDINDAGFGAPFVTIASMFVNTNDGFIAINGELLKRNDVYYLPGLDAGSEVNDELCENIPGPAAVCAAFPTNGRVAENGVVHVHLGFHGIGTPGFTPERYDWRNPMMRAEVQCFREGLVTKIE